MNIIDRFDSDREIDQETPQRWLDVEFGNDIPDAPESWGLEDFDDVLSNVGYDFH